MDEKTTPNPLTPEEFTGLRTESPPSYAAGKKAVTISAKHLKDAMPISRASKVMLDLNQVHGVDCPGCAWPDPDDHRSKVGEYCENGAKAIAEEATTHSIGPEFFSKHSVAELSKQSDFWLGKRGRLTHPMIVRPGKSHYEAISWDDAFALISKELIGLNSPDEAIFYTSGRTSNEAAFLYQLMVRQLGTNNMPDCSNMCHESSGVALSETVGIGKGSVKLEDFYQTDLIIVSGQNPGTNHPRMLTALQKAKKNGAKIITINPLPEAGLMAFKNPQKLSGWVGGATTLTDLFLQVRINGDVPLVKALLRLMLDAEKAKPGSVFDQEFIAEKTAGYEAFLADLEQQEFSVLARESGVSQKDLTEAAELIMSSKRIIACWAMGLTQHKNGVENITELVNLLLVKGSIGKPGAGTCPVRGHSNVQGDRTMGIWENPKPAFLDKLKEVFDFEPPRKPGYDTVGAIKAMQEGKGKVFIAMGGNFISATPDTSYTARAMQRCDLTVQISTKLNRSHLIHGKTALILPCLARTDEDIKGGSRQFVSVENSMGVVHQSTGKLKPVSSNMLSEPEIVCRLAHATFEDESPVNWNHFTEDYDHIRDAIEKVIPGFENYNERVRKDGGFYLPNGARVGDFKTSTGKANFSVNPLPENQLAEGELYMMTVRSHDQFNTTIYGLDDRYRGIYNERRVIMMNAKDIQAAGLGGGDVVDLIGLFKGVERNARKFVIVPYDIPEGCTATYFPEANTLIPIDSVAAKSNTPTSKLVKITIQKAL